MLDIADVSGSRVVETAYLPRVGVRDAHAAAALEVMSRFAIDPRWLLYLPPTMSPVATQPDGDLLEHPDQAFAAYRADGVAEVVCEEKHMGSRAVLLVCRSPQDAAARFGVTPAPGAVWTRTGRPFFPARQLSRAPRLAARARLREAAEEAGLFAELDTSWLLLDAELVPWNVKAGALLRDQYAAVGAAALASLPVAVSALEQAAPAACPASASCWTVPGRAWPTRRRSPPPTCATAGPPTGWPGCASPRSSCSPPRAPSTTSGRTCGTSPWPTGSPPRARADHGHPPDLRRYQRSRPGHSVVGGADRRRGRGHGGQARREPDPRATRATVAQASRAWSSPA